MPSCRAITSPNHVLSLLYLVLETFLLLYAAKRRAQDMRLVEYDLDSSSISAGLHLAARTEVEQRCPTIYIYLNIYNLAIYGYTCNFM